MQPDVEQRCYRHADRRAGVSCQRCGRPICPSCMVTASVGFQCPECTRGGARQQRLVDAFGARQPNVTYALLAVNVGVFLLGYVVPSLDTNGALFGPLIKDGEWWRIITGGFIHAGMLHVAFNMYALYLMGNVMERVIGPVRFGLIYLVSLLGGSVGALLLNPDALTVGASGAIFGLFAAFACLELSVGHNPMRGGIGPTILINLVITLVFSGMFSVSDATGIRISAGGHLGGLAAGAICGAVMFGINPAMARARRQQRTAAVYMCAGLAVGLFVAAVAAANILATTWQY